MAMAMNQNPYHLDALFARGSGRRLDLQNPVAPNAWHWGAFVFGGVWAIANDDRKLGVGLLLLDLIPPLGILAHLWCGANGHRLAYNARRFESVDAYRQSQDRWNLPAVALMGAASLAGVTAMMISHHHHDPETIAHQTRPTSNVVGRRQHALPTKFTVTRSLPRISIAPTQLAAQIAHAYRADQDYVEHQETTLERQIKSWQDRAIAMFAQPNRTPIHTGPARRDLARHVKPPQPGTAIRPTMVAIAPAMTTTKPRQSIRIETLQVDPMPKVQRPAAAPANLPTCERAWTPINAAIDATSSQDRFANSIAALAEAAACNIPAIRNETEALAYTQKAIAEHDDHQSGWTEDLSNAVKAGSACSIRNDSNTSYEAARCFVVANHAATMAADWIRTN